MKYPVLFDERCYELATYFLQDESGLHTHDKCNELARVIQKNVEDWISTERDNVTPETT